MALGIDFGAMDAERFFFITRRRILAGLGGALSLPGASAAPLPPVMRVGPGQKIKTLAAAAGAARDGMLIEVEAGDYVADVAVWPQSDLTLKAVGGGRVRLLANGASAQGKGIFVTTGERIRIEGFDFIGATVPDRNGAGIRLERGSLSLRDCTFMGNENGLLSSNDPAVRLEIEDCEFGPILARAEGRNHNLYVGAIAFLKVTGSYFHQGQLGHLLKSRAAVNHIFYNRLSDEIGGRASYELEFPNGGLALVVGNVIQQSSTTENPHMISFGAEGYPAGRQQGLHLVNNTLIDLRPSGGSYLRVAPGPVQVRLINNVLAGNRHFASNAYWEQRNNHVVDLDEFVLAARGNYGLRPGSGLRGKFVDPGEVEGVSLTPTRQFRGPRGSVALAGPARYPGAVQRP